VGLYSTIRDNLLVLAQSSPSSSSSSSGGGPAVNVNGSSSWAVAVQLASGMITGGIGDVDMSPRLCPNMNAG
jgi:hypothetical protein